MRCLRQRKLKPIDWMYDKRCWPKITIRFIPSALAFYTEWYVLFIMYLFIICTFSHSSVASWIKWVSRSGQRITFVWSYQIPPNGRIHSVCITLIVYRISLALLRCITISSVFSVHNSTFMYRGPIAFSLLQIWPVIMMVNWPFVKIQEKTESKYLFNCAFQCS